MRIKLNIADILRDSQVGGPGLRDLIWLQGCSIRCKGCFNKELWSYKPNHIIDVDKLISKFESRVGEIEGVTILGGEPTEQAFGLTHFFKGIKQIGLTTVLYTGRTFQWHKDKNDKWVNELLLNTDILIDGAFISEFYDSNLLWRGSTNQNILFLSSSYDKSILNKYKSVQNEEIHIFVENENEKRFITGIS